MEKIFKILSCPTCGFEINEEVESCTKCGRHIQHKNNRIYFTHFNSEESDNLLFKVKHFVKIRTNIYDYLVAIFGPVFILPLKLSLSRFFKNYRKSFNQVIVNIGSGNTQIIEDIINLDIIDYKNVKIISDLDRLPFRDNSIDILVNIAVLEHVKNPEGVVAEIERVLKPGGMVYSYIPFMQPFHASPFDFKRYSSEGIKNLYNKFEIISVKPTGGPVSAFLWIMQECFALILSFGIKPLYYHIQNGSLSFASEVKALQQAGIATTVNKNWRQRN